MKEIACGGETFTPSKVVCVGMNFRAHAKEMGSSAPPREPVIFLKPNSAIAFNPEAVHVPEGHGLLHHEIELCVLLGRGGASLGPDEARAAVAGYAVGIDFTLRDRQAEAKSKGRPWALAKGFDGSCALGGFSPAADAGAAEGRAMELSVNNETRQKGSTSDMVFSPSEILAFVSRFMSLERGDILMCGTPSGVGEVKHGDRIRADIEGLPGLDFKVRRRD